jgi:hypothetical protein
MTTPRSLFTEAIEEHLALKRQNAQLAEVMPIHQYDVGDPLSRYPGGPVTPADEVPAVAAPVDAVADTGGIAAVDAPPLSGMVPTLSLVDDLDETSLMPSPIAQADIDGGEVVRFPGGVGADRDSIDSLGMSGMLATAEPIAPSVHMTPADDVPAADAADAEMHSPPVIVIDAEEPLAREGGIEPMVPRNERKSGGGFFGLRRGKKRDRSNNNDGWFQGQPRDFEW